MKKPKFNLRKSLFCLTLLASFNSVQAEDFKYTCGDYQASQNGIVVSSVDEIKRQFTEAEAELDKRKKEKEKCETSMFGVACDTRFDNYIAEAQSLVDELTTKVAAGPAAVVADTCKAEWDLLNADIMGRLIHKGYSVGDNHETSQARISDTKLDLVSLLPEITKDNFPIVAQGKECARNQAQKDCNYVVIEVLSSSEKATPIKEDNKTDDFLIQMAENFNSKNRKTKSGKIIQIRVRKMASGTAYQYLSNGKYAGDKNTKDRIAGLAYSPSNSLWVKMLEAQAGKVIDYKVEPVKIKRDKIALKPFRDNPEAMDNVKNNVDGVVGNVAGVFMRKDAVKKFFPAGAPSNSCDIINKVINGEIKMGYTNPYVSSTGLNFLWTALTCLSPEDPTSEAAVAKFRDFQKNVPALFETTLTMRESVRTGGSIDAGVVEYQTFVNTKINKKNEPEVKMSEVFEFIPFGIRHDNPMVHININNPKYSDDENEENNKLYAEGLKIFAEDIATHSGAVRMAQKYGFFGNPTFTSKYELPADGAGLVVAQKVWKENKSGGIPVIATFVADVSGSMEGDKMSSLQKALEVASGFIRPDMNVGLIEYADEILERLPIGQFTPENHGRFVQVARTLKINGGTPLYPATMIGIQKVLEAKAQLGTEAKMMVFVLADGAANIYRRNDREVKALIGHAKQYGIQIHVLGFGSGADMGSLGEMATPTEGAIVQIESTEEQEIKEKMGKLFNSQL